MRKLLILFISSIFLISCAQEQSGTADENLATSAEAAINTISALADDSQGEDYALSTPKKSIIDTLNEALFPKAYAAGCIRPINQACVAQEKVSVFDECSMFRGFVTVSGTVKLAFSTPDCSLDNTGDNVARTYDYTFDGPRGGQLRVSSDDHLDYNGNTIGGGALATKTTDGWNLKVLGKHKVFTRNGNVRMDKSIRTLRDLEITGGLRRHQRRVNNGQLEVIHNLAEFTALYTANDLAWSSSCCHPVSGTLSVEYSGSKTGEGTITFTGCGTAELDKDGDKSDIQFTYCE